MTKFGIITGASRGIGAGLAHYFAKQGYDLALIARSEEALNHVKKSILLHSPTVDITTHTLDLSDSTKTYDYIRSCVANKGHIDVVFNNAGIAIDGTSEISIADFEYLHAINLNGLFAVAKAVAEAMKKQGFGYIFNLASIIGKYTVAEYGAYCSSKFAVVGFSDALFKELMPYGVKVTALCPSVVDTDMTRNFNLESDQKIQIDDIVKTVDYLLSLSPQAVLSSVDILCRSIVEQSS